MFSKNVEMASKKYLYSKSELQYRCTTFGYKLVYENIDIHQLFQFLQYLADTQ